MVQVAADVEQMQQRPVLAETETLLPLHRLKVIMVEMGSPILMEAAEVEAAHLLLVQQPQRLLVEKVATVLYLLFPVRL